MTLDIDRDVSGSDDLSASQRTGSVVQREGVDEQVLRHLKHSLLDAFSDKHEDTNPVREARFYVNTQIFANRLATITTFKH